MYINWHVKLICLRRGLAFAQSQVCLQACHPVYEGSSACQAIRWAF